MRISIIAAMATNHVIGLNNALPWHLPADLRHFKSVTMGKPVVMGRKTFESIGKPLPGRMNIVISHNPNFQAAGCHTVRSIEQALEQAGEQDEVMIIGGASFYRQILPRADRLYLTLVHASFDGDAFFPDYRQADWRVLEREDHKADDKNSCDYSFLVLERAG